MQQVDAKYQIKKWLEHNDVGFFRFNSGKLMQFRGVLVVEWLFAAQEPWFIRTICVGTGKVY